jgi:dipeptidyl aminopeptidase/acylaminoacyl peptidase
MEMISVRAASRPHPSLGDAARIWDRFVGTWDCEYTFFLEDGSVGRAAGELEFGWTLDGRAVQDIWIRYPTGAEKERTMGTSIRIFDDQSRTWHVVFVSPAERGIQTLQGGAEGDRIVLRGTNREGEEIRWSFNDIQDDAFVWRGEKSRDGGKTWLLTKEHRMRRRPALAR